MSDSDSIPVTRHLSEAELDARLREADDVQRLRRLGFIKNLYQGDSVTVAINREGRSRSTGHRWKNRWDEGGIEAMLPNESGGRPQKLDGDERERFRAIVRQRQPCSTDQIERILASEFDVEYAASYLPTVLANLGLSYETPALEIAIESETLDEITWDTNQHRDTTRRHPLDRQSSRLTGGWSLADDA